MLVSVQLDGDRLALGMEPEQDELEHPVLACVASSMDLPRLDVRDRTRLQALLRLSLDGQRAVAFQHVHNFVALVIVAAVRPARRSLQPGDDQLVFVDSRQLGTEKRRLGKRSRGGHETLSYRADGDADNQYPGDHRRADGVTSEAHSAFLPDAVGPEVVDANLS